MKYFVLSFIFLINIAGLCFFALVRQKIKKNMIYSLLADFFQSNQKNNLHLSLFQNSLILLATDVIYHAKKKKQEEIISDLKKNHKQKLKSYLMKESPVLCLALWHLFFLKQNFSFSKNKKAVTLTDRLALCLIYESTFCYHMLEKELSEISLFILSKHKRHLTNLMKARAAFLKTDLKKASKLLLNNLRHFRHPDFYEEQAYTYFMLGEIYRVCGLFDTADMMFRTSSEIYQKAGHFYGTKFILSSYALNCLQAGRLEEAESCFKKALSSFKKQKDTIHEAEILNQLALLSNINQNHIKARKLASSALKKHLSTSNVNGIAFSNEQMAYAYFHLKHFDASQKCALAAQKLYHKQKNESASQSLKILLNDIKKAQVSHEV